MADYGFKVSKDGFDATTAATENMVIDWDINTLKVKATGTITGTTGTVSASHGLSYAPAYMAIKKDASGRANLVGAYSSVYVTSAGLFLDGSSGYSHRYYIFYNKLSG